MNARVHRLYSGRALWRVLACSLLLPLCAGCVSHWKPYTIREPSPGIYKGRRPTAPEEMRQLRRRGIRTILSLEKNPLDIWDERRQARREGVNYRSVPILASPFQPPEKQVKQALLILADPALRPIYIHCLLGEDRNTFILGLYRIYFQDWSAEAAWEEMLRSGFHDAWRLRGFTTYFWSHTSKPEWVIRLRSNKPD